MTAAPVLRKPWARRDDGKPDRLRGRQWQRIRERVLAEQPLCVDCLAKARTTVAREIDHADGDRTNNERANLRPLCVECHQVRTIRARGHAPRPRIGVDGYPLPD